MEQPCPHCDQLDTSLLRLVLIGEILSATESRLVLLADVIYQCDQCHWPTRPMSRRCNGEARTGLTAYTTTVRRRQPVIRYGAS